MTVGSASTAPSPSPASTTSSCGATSRSHAPLPVVVLNAAGIPITNSRNVAEWFGKRHTNVLRALDEMECSAEFTQLNFEPSTYTDATGRSLRSINMTKDGLVFLIMGFTGRKAAAFKEAYIARFNEMEAEQGPPL